MERRKLSLHERAGGGGGVDVYWDDGLNYAPDDRGLPVAVLTAHSAELWTVNVNTHREKVVVRRLLGINEAIRALLLHLPDRYS